jgi:hypothetical protein
MSSDASSSAAAYLTQTSFHHIALNHPYVRLVHSSPYIFVCDDFITPDECKQLIRMHANGRPSPSATDPAQETLRTSTSAFPPEADIMWLRQRIAQITNTTLAQLEPTKVSRYASGEYFKKHTDASFLHEKLWACSARLAEVEEDGMQAPCEWPSRFVTLFLYLNDVSSGGTTNFHWLDGEESVPGARIFSQCIEHEAAAAEDATGIAVEYLSNAGPGAAQRTPRLSIAPRAGQAVIHFPTTTPHGPCGSWRGCIPDPRTMHESAEAVDTKYIVQQFIWPVPIDPSDAHWHEDVRKEWAAILAAATREAGAAAEAEPYKQ